MQHLAADQPTPIFDALFTEATHPKQREKCPCEVDDSTFYTPADPDVILLTRPNYECDGSYWGNVILSCFDLSADASLEDVGA